MRRCTLLFLFALPLMLGPALAFQGKSPSAPGQVKKKAHADIKKWVKAQKRKLKSETKLYDDLVGWGIPSAEALKSVKLVIEHDLDIGDLSHFARRRAEKGIRGKMLHETIFREVKKRVEEAKKKKSKKPAAPKPKGKAKHRR